PGCAHGGACAAPAEVPGRQARNEERPRLLRVRRAGEAQDVDAHECQASRKAALWSAISGLAHIGSTSFGPGLYPSWYFAISAAAYGLILPVVASLHVRHQLVRQSGAVLGTIAGASVVTLGLGAAANPDLIPAALFVRGIWWWTIGKMWAETAVLPRIFGFLTMLLAVLCVGLVGLYAATGVPMAPPDLPLRMILGVWLIGLAAFLWRTASTPTSPT